MAERDRRLTLPPDVSRLPPGSATVEKTVTDAVRAVLGRLGKELAGVEARRDPGGRWSTVVRLGRQLVDDGRGGMVEAADLVIAAVGDGRLAELLAAGPVEVVDTGPTVTMSVSVPGHLVETVRAVINAAATDAKVNAPRRSTKRTLTLSTPGAPKATAR